MRLLVLGTGSMANGQADHFAKIKGVTLVGAVDVHAAGLKAFCEKHAIKKSFATLEDAIKWGQFDAVTNVTPDNVHYATTMQALAAGKHVFCEKPLATDAKKAFKMTEAAEKAGLVGMVNLTYRNVAPLQAAHKMVAAGEIGAVRHVEASYLQSWLVSKAWGDWRNESRWLWRLSKKHGSNGVLGDIGIHIFDFALYGAGADLKDVFCRLHTFHKAPNDKIGDYDLDANDSFAATAQLKGGALAVIHASRFATGHMNDLRLRVFGDKGALEVLHTPKGSWLKVCLGADVETATWQEREAEPVETNYQRFAKAVKKVETMEPSFRRAAEMQQVLDDAITSDKKRKEVAK